MKKRVLSLVLAVVLVCAMIPMAGATEYVVTEIVPCKYDANPYFSEGFAAVKVEGKYGFIDQTGREVIPCKYDFAGGFSDGLAYVEVDKKWGFIDKTGAVVIDLKYDKMPGSFKKYGLAHIEVDGKQGFVDKAGNEKLFSEKYDDVTIWSDKLFLVEKRGGPGMEMEYEYGLVNEQGKEVLPCQYHSIMRAEEEERLWVKMNGKWGLIDMMGKEIVPCQYGTYMGWTLTFSEGLAAVEKDNKWGFINTKGEEVIPFVYSGAKNFSEGLAAVQDEERKSGYINTEGEKVIPCQYFIVGDFQNGFACVSEGKVGKQKYGLIDKTGKEIVPCKYSGMRDVVEGMAGVRMDDKFGYVDTKGNEVVSLQYDYVGDFNQGLAKVCRDGNWGYIDQTGREVIPCEYFEEGDEKFKEGFVRVPREDGMYYYDKDGTRLPCRYRWIGELEGGFAPVEQDGKYGFIFVTTVAATAYPSTQKVDVDGKAIEFQCYALKDANGNDTNYIKLRDLADILNGSAVQFEVGWNGQVTITTGKGYTKNGSEQKTPFSGQRTYQEVTAPTLVNGEARDLAAFTLTDDKGGGYTYYKLRDLGDALGFKVDWTRERGIFIETK